MIFTSFLFLFAFLPVFLFSYISAPEAWRRWIIILASLLFYAAWRIDFVALLVAVTVYSYLIAKWINRTHNQAGRTALVSLGVGANVACLGYFKYWNFGIDTLNALSQRMGYGTLASHWSIILPLGISFFTFHAVSYIVDVYRKTTPGAPNLSTFTLYMALFPHLIAGPIVRYAEISNQIERLQPSWALFDRGTILFVIGFCKKVIIANNLANVADPVFAGNPLTFSDAWLGTLAYALELYFDFSGYSDMAIGMAAMMGISFPQNFRSPYKSRGISEFWRRWHMTLSRFLRDYLYIPLGGNRRHTYRNLWVTMLLGGLWHGASWTFVLWGAWHGLLLVIERANARRPLYWFIPGPLQTAVTFVLVCIGWVLFRSPSASTAVAVYAAMINLGHGLALEATSTTADTFFFIIFLTAIVIAFLAPNSEEIVKRELGRVPRFALAAVFIIAIHEMFIQSYTPFLYFQF